MTAPRPKKPKQPKIIVGWNEIVAIPDWRVTRLKAKVDTGARSSSLHVKDLIIDDQTVSFAVLCDHQGFQTVTTPLVRVAKVTSSNGIAQERCFVHAQLQLGPLCRQIEVSLVHRGDMRFPMLIGRTALKGRYQVDPGRRRLVSPPPLPEGP